MPIENSRQVNQGVAVCSEKEFDTFQVPSDRFEVAETSSKIDVEDCHNLSKLVEENPIEFRLSVRLDRIDQSVFFLSNEKRDSFKIDNLYGSFGEDMETSSDDDVPITPSARKTDRNKARLSTPRPRYKPLKVKITKSPPRKVSKPLPHCWVLLNKLNFDDYKGSCSSSSASSSHCLAGYSK
ncbi:uncharacterized protein LOC120355205 [Nilaparvata lugens]|uniref:uncharacterized protein LOC120355204 n=1 Tax=Nilaparvata lugens TaxID=108931 RepID=UPI00193D77E0|nr:uncharacterized protein LOC120355204 [Nilaparvata lugens]XP_039299474.1 uncharacterized protein LOC120355205 [Nilaparvata lugens]